MAKRHGARVTSSRWVTLAARLAASGLEAAGMHVLDAVMSHLKG